jgi:hypothetical protein
MLSQVKVASHYAAMVRRWKEAHVFPETWIHASDGILKLISRVEGMVGRYRCFRGAGLDAEYSAR